MTLDGTVNGESAEPLEYPHPMAPYDLAKEVALLKERNAQVEAGAKSFTLEEVESDMTSFIRSERL